ncbi:MAG: hypothetical protein OEV99_15540 [Nitrospira sp.]|nr:hypothetical protein [Nitrospira sp.]
MKPVIFPLKLQMKRTEVGDLQQALSALGFTIAGPEARSQRFFGHQPARRRARGEAKVSRSFQVLGCRSEQEKGTGRFSREQS